MYTPVGRELKATDGGGSSVCVQGEREGLIVPSGPH